MFWYTVQAAEISLNYIFVFVQDKMISQDIMFLAQLTNQNSGETNLSFELNQSRQALDSC